MPGERPGNVTGNILGPHPPPRPRGRAMLKLSFVTWLRLTSEANAEQVRARVC